jgi:hypothetical protein
MGGSVLLDLESSVSERSGSEGFLLLSPLLVVAATHKRLGARECRASVRGRARQSVEVRPRHRHCWLDVDWRCGWREGRSDVKVVRCCFW